MNFGSAGRNNPLFTLPDLPDDPLQSRSTLRFRVDAKSGILQMAMDEATATPEPSAGPGGAMATLVDAGPAPGINDSGQTMVDPNPPDADDPNRTLSGDAVAPPTELRRAGGGSATTIISSGGATILGGPKGRSRPPGRPDSTTVDLGGQQPASVSLSQDTVGQGVMIRGVDDTAASIHPFQLIEQIAEGGMGEIWRARQLSLSRTIAVKRSKRDSRRPDTAVAERQFIAEAVVTASLQHPNIMPIHDIARDVDGRLLLAMKEIKGLAWSSLLHPERVEDPKKRAEVERRADRLSQRDHLRFFLSVCDAIAYAHANQILHRDLKPDQVMIGDYGEVILLDWGLAIPIADAKTGVDQIAGTPAYLAPEMTDVPGAKLDERTDIYLLGGILYEILTLQAPHNGGNAYKCLFLASQGIVTPPSKVRPGALIPRELERLAMRCLAARPDDRPASVKEIAREIREYLTYKAGELQEKDAFWEVRKGSQPAQERDIMIKAFVGWEVGRYAHEEFSSSTREGSKRGSAALECEARILRLFQHANMPVLYDTDSDAEGRPILLMRPYQGKNLGLLMRPHPDYFQWSLDFLHRYLDGMSEEAKASMIKAYDDWKAGPFLDLESLVEVLIKTCDALMYAHTFGIVHRHLKPASLFVGEYGNVTVTDWGFALDVRPEPRRPPIAAPPKSQGTGRVPPFSAPEVLRLDFESVTYTTDSFGIGALLYYALCGYPPNWPKDRAPKDYEDMIPPGIEGGHLPPSVRAPKDWVVPQELDALALELLSVDPLERPDLIDAKRRLMRAWKKL